MKIGVRDLCLELAGYRTVAEGLRALDLSAVEVAVPKDGVVPLPDSGERVLLDDQGCARYRDEAAACGIDVCALLVSQNFGLTPVGPEIDWVVMAVRAAECLGARSLRIDSAMARQDELPLGDRIEMFAAATERALERTTGSQVRLGIENHGRQGNNQDWMDGVLEQVGNHRLGLTLDIANWYWYGNPLTDLYGIYETYARHTVHTHMKSIAYPEDIRETRREVGHRYGELCCSLDQGDIDISRVIEILRTAGYDGALVVENEALYRHSVDQRADLLKRDVAHLKALLQ